MAYSAAHHRVRRAGCAAIAALIGFFVSAACGSGAPAPDEAQAATSTASIVPTTSTTPPDARFLRVKEALEASGLVADVKDDTVLAVVRGVCDQLNAGVPERDVLATLRPIAAYAAGATGSQMTADDAAVRYLGIAREEYC
ncbi:MULTISPECIES: DUF732 domain-containing protein [unclassified Rhodococcus (in: high G+C Gram-positive bacteria)]|uniref:DUF732 domain-containing protein n=1 Tax=unclassified Rhodococcus (in: high G+C Gram-positive bacteria) TaxID=192944 RepID=UPI001BD60D50|nr:MULTISPECIES: DUF732 domain-containing protein [unclassified Rhodococcus (in: high G+C Gram-positive bacteria)]MBS9371855.1 hypothetical protein [Rhodococcus sp. B50]MDC3727998.1 hypothetical protein [Rhodococcus sp. Rp3]